MSSWLSTTRAETFHRSQFYNDLYNLITAEDRQGRRKDQESQSELSNLSRDKNYPGHVT